ncbi:MAG: hypothetical protein GX573_11810, partial [Chloroflexi bacterium]|nr:hypothetical protein [Chloroflexota bacterium]
MRGRSAALALEGLLLVAIVAFAAYLRLANLRDNPGWYTDEATHLEIARHAAEGRTQYMAFNQTTLLVARMPVFPWLISRAMLAFDLYGADSILAARTLSALLNTLAVVLLYAVARTATRREPSGRALALVAAALLATSKSAVVLSRIAFSYNLLAVLVLIMVWGLWLYLDSSRRRWLALAACAIGAGIMSDLLALNLLVPFAVVILSRRPRDLLWSVPLALVPFGIYAAASLLTVPDAFLYDLRFTLGRMGAGSFIMQVPNVLINFVAFVMLLDIWLLPGVVGLFLLRPPRFQRLALLICWLMIIALQRTVGLSHLSFYYFISVLPLLVLGTAALIVRGVPFLTATVSGGLRAVFSSWTWWPEGPRWRWLENRAVSIGTMLVVYMVAVHSFLFFSVFTVYEVTNGLETEIDKVLLDPDDARAVARVANEMAAPDDVLIVSPTMGWLLDAHVADFQMAVTALGKKTEHLPGDIPADRYLFDARYTTANYVIVDNL